MRLAALILALLAPLAGAGSITLEIRHLWDGKPLELSGAPVRTRAGEAISVTRLSYLLSGPRLLGKGDDTASGDWIGRDDWFAFVDAGGGNPSLTLAGLPAGDYTTLRFHLGLDEATDRADPNRYPARHPLNPLVNNLHWTPQGGYIFLALEGHMTRDGEATGFAYHLGNPWNRVAVTLPAALDLSRDVSLTLDFHLDRLFNTAPFLRIADRESTHSRKGDPLAAKIRQRTASCFTVADVRPTAAPAVKKPDAKPVNTVGTPYRFTVKRGFPIPDLPTDYPLTNERVRLGETIFYDMDLSKSDTFACASCHNPGRALTDGVPLARGDDGSIGTRNTMPLFNLAWKDKLLWDGRVERIRDQIVIPITHPREMNESVDHVLAEMAARPAYRKRFAEAFGSPGITIGRLGVALEQFLLTRTSFDSKFDRAARGDGSLSDEEKRGFELFMTEYDPRRGQFGADCFHCHGGPFFTDHRFHNNGLYDAGDLGLAIATGRKSDAGKFATPSLRNIALTAPYMHDGRLATLEEVVSHYNGPLDRRQNLDPNLAKHPRDGIQLPPADQTALVAFLRTLTDPKYVE